MSEYLIFLILDIINKSASIGTILKLGYSYSEALKMFNKLENMGYVYTDDEIKQGITQRGKNKLLELEEKYRYKEIAKLEQYKVEKMSLEDIYLP